MTQTSFTTPHITPYLMKSKTTLLGVFTILAAVINTALTFLKTGSLGDIGTTAGLISGGIGLIKAADSK